MVLSLLCPSKGYGGRVLVFQFPAANADWWNFVIHLRVQVMKTLVSDPPRPGSSVAVVWVVNDCIPVRTVLPVHRRQCFRWWYFAFIESAAVVAVCRLQIVQVVLSLSWF